MNKAMVCIVRSALVPAPLVMRLTEAGIAHQAISVLVPDWPEAGDPLASVSAAGRAPGKQASAEGATGAPGSVFGRLAGLGLLAIPGLGMFVAAGPIIAALSAATLDLARGRVTAALVTMGLPEPEAQVCEARVAAGQSLLSVQTRGVAQARQAREVLAAF